MAKAAREYRFGEHFYGGYASIIAPEGIAGKSTWKGVPDTNDYSIGIEMVNKNDGIDPYPPAQYQAMVALCKVLVAKYSIKIDDIMGHKDISLSGKTDPAGFDLDQFRRDVAS